MKSLKFCIVIAIGFVMTSCAVINDILENGGAQLLGEYATDGYIRSMAKRGADAESIQQLKDLADNAFGPNRIDHIQAWHEANNVDKVRNVSREILTVLSNTKHMSESQMALNTCIDMIDGAANSLNALSAARDQGTRNTIIASTIFDLGTMHSEYTRSAEYANRRFNRMCKKDPSIADEYEVAAVEYEYVRIYDEDGKYQGADPVPSKWAIVRKSNRHNYEYENDSESLIMEDELNERVSRYWDSLKSDSQSSPEVESEEPVLKEEPELPNTEEEVVNHEDEMKKQAVNRINETCIDRYEFDKTELNDTQKHDLSEVAVLLNEYPGLSICLTGHTCDIGTDNVNYKKGFNRAEAAKMFLVEQGVSAERISVESAGASVPCKPNDSAENRKANRRVTFSVQ